MTARATSTAPNRGDPEFSMLPGGDGGVLTIDLAALRSNYRHLRELARSADVAGVVKANAYGLGVERVAQALWSEGCRTFCVAFLNEAATLVRHLPEPSEVLVLNGLQPGSESHCADLGVVPVLNSLEQVQRWSLEGSRRNLRLPAAIQVDSGMARLGLSPGEVDTLSNDPGLLGGVDTTLVMSHLACADEPHLGANRSQLDAFRSSASRLPDARRSLSNSSGLLLDPSFAFDLVRPGIGLYGAALSPSQPMNPVIGLQAAVVQTRDVPAGTGIGY